MNRTFCLPALMTAALLGGCATSNNNSPVATAGQGQVILVCRPADGAKAAEIIPLANTLANEPGVLDVSAATGPSTAVNSAGDEAVFVLTYRPNAAPQNRDWQQTVKAAGLDSKVASVTTHNGTLQNYLVSKQYSDETTAADLQRRSAAIKQQRELYDRTK